MQVLLAHHLSITPLLPENYVKQQLSQAQKLYLFWGVETRKYSENAPR